MKRLIQSFTSYLLLTAPLVWADEVNCLNTAVRVGPAPSAEDFKRVDLAPSHNSAREAMISTWWQASCPDFQQQDVRGYKQDNLICRIEGQGSSTLVVGAHYDKFSEGRGVADNWSGAVLLDSLMQTFKTRFTSGPPPFNIEFVAFAAEEPGLFGSKAYVRQHADSTRAMINIDTIGLRELVVGAESDPQLICQSIKIAETLKTPLSVIAWRDISSDHNVFRKQGIPVISLHSVTRKTLRRIHSRRDKPGNVDLDLMVDAFKVAEALILQQLAKTDE